ncbi:MAG: GTP pyrophosphokinase family protein [Butyrivibrio sp.]|nr:GTP pyrophosphokinase family protein [Butyrivibrio sp.]
MAYEDATFNYGNVFQGLSHISEHEIEQVLHLTKDAKRFRELMMKYDCAISEVRTKLEILNRDMSLKYQRNPFESIKSRLKTPTSIYEKLVRRGLPVTYDSIANELNDIAGVRVVCSFVDDIYTLADCLTEQDDILVIQRKDYLKNPKDNGYRSLHLIVCVPVFLTDRKEPMKVEVQFRTIAMDFWASLEHHMKYKKDIRNPEMVSDEMRYASDLINQLDKRMMQIREKIDYAE